MPGSEFDEDELFRQVARSGARALLIGRRALVALGLPVMTADYDYWIHPDDAAAFNQALAPLGLSPNRSPEEARRVGRYVLENDEHVDVLVARAASTVGGVTVTFDDVWQRRVLLRYDATTTVAVPSVDDLILTKRWSMRDRDVADIRLLESIKAARGGGT